VAQNPGSFTVDVDGSYLIRLQLTCPKLTVTSATIPAGSTITINGVTLTGVAGARTPGADDFSVSGGTIAAHCLEIAAAINDGANSFGAITGASNASPDIVWNPLTIPLTVSWSTGAPFAAGQLVTEQFVRLRALTAFGSLRLIAAGERYDTVSVPVDITPAGWADEQNFNLNTLLGYVKTTEASQRLLFVDPVAGDYQTIQAAVDYAVSQTPTLNLPWTIAIRPGRYTEDLVLHPYVNLIGWPASESSDIVVVECGTNPHTLTLTPVGSKATFVNIVFSRPAAAASACFDVNGTSDTNEAHFVRCAFSHAGNGPALQVGSAHAFLSDCDIHGGTAAGDYGLRLYELGGNGGKATLRSTDLTGDQGVLIEPRAGANSSFLTAVTCSFNNVGANSVTANGPANMFYCVWTGSATTDIAANPSGVAIVGDLNVHAGWSQFNAASVDDTGVAGTTTFGVGSCVHGTLSTAGTASFSADVHADSVFYDNTTSGIAAEDVQAALDEIYAYAALVRTLDDAYDGGVAASGSGRTIVADAGSVQILDAAAPSDPIPPRNTHGNLEVVGSVSIGGIGKPEIALDPNPFGSGPVLRMGHEIWNGSAKYGSSAFIEGYSTQDGDYHNYNLILTTTPTDAGVAPANEVGNVIVRGGVGLNGIKTDPSGGSVHLLGGEAAGDTATADGGSVYIAPGDANAGSTGSIFIGRAQTATPAALTASAVAADPLGVSGDITIGTDMGTATATLDAADNLATVLSKLSSCAPTTDPASFFTASEAGGIITLTTVTKGPTAQIFWVSSDAGIDAALGTLSTQTQVDGTWPDQMEVVVSAANEISFGPSGATGPLVYNADTGKLTVPGVIDPTGMIYTESTLTNLTLPVNGWTGSGVGGLYVSDGTDGQDNNHLYYVFETGTPIKLSGGGTGTVVGPGSSTDNALARFDGTTGQLLQDSPAILTDLGALTGLVKVTTENLEVVTGTPPVIGQVLSAIDVAGNVGWATVGGGGDVTGPVSATDEALARYDGATGKVVQNSEVTLSDFSTDPSGDIQMTFNGGTAGAGVSTLLNLDHGGANSDVAAITFSSSGTSKGLFGLVGSLDVLVIQDSGGNERFSFGTEAAGTPGVLRINNSFSLPDADGTPNQVLQTDGVGNVTWQTPASGGGDVTGPVSSTDNAIARFDLATGKVIQNSSVTIDDSGNLLSGSNITTTGTTTISGPTISATTTVVTPALRVSTSPTAGYVLTSDAIGNATWAAPATGGGTVTSSLDFTRTTGTAKIADITANDIVLSVWVRFTQAFDDVSATVQIIENGVASAVVPASSLDPTDITTPFSFDPVFINTTSANEIQINVQPAGSTQGTGTVIVMIHEV